MATGCFAAAGVSFLLMLFVNWQKEVDLTAVRLQKAVAAAEEAAAAAFWEAEDLMDPTDGQNLANHRGTSWTVGGASPSNSYVAIPAAASGVTHRRSFVIARRASSGSLSRHSGEFARSLPTRIAASAAASRALCPGTSGSYRGGCGSFTSQLWLLADDHTEPPSPAVGLNA